MSVISAGQLRHRVTVYTASTAVDAYGQRSQTLTVGPTIYAEVRATGASEIGYGDGAAMRTQYQIRTRWRTGVNADRRDEPARVPGRPAPGAGPRPRA